jgi:hypothetical protein
MRTNALDINSCSPTQVTTLHTYSSDVTAFAVSGTWPAQQRSTLAPRRAPRARRQDTLRTADRGQQGFQGFKFRPGAGGEPGAGRAPAPGEKAARRRTHKSILTVRFKDRRICTIYSRARFPTTSAYGSASVSCQVKYSLRPCLRRYVRLYTVQPTIVVLSFSTRPAMLACSGACRRYPLYTLTVDSVLLMPTAY